VVMDDFLLIVITRNKISIQKSSSLVVNAQIIIVVDDVCGTR
jgi:hypothetical protein